MKGTREDEATGRCGVSICWLMCRGGYTFLGQCPYFKSENSMVAVGIGAMVRSAMGASF